MRYTLTGLLLVAALTLSVFTAHAQDRTFETMTVSTTEVGLSDATISPAVGSGQMVSCFAQVETAAIRFTTSGTTPTSAVGIPVAAGSYITITGTNALRRFQAIRSGGSDATLQWECSRSENDEATITGAGGGGGGGAVTNAGTFAVQEDGAALTALQLLDNAVAGSEFQVDVITMPTTTVTATNLDVQSGGLDLLSESQFIATMAAGITADPSTTVVVRPVDSAGDNITNATADAMRVTGVDSSGNAITPAAEYTDDTSTHATGTTTGPAIFAAATPTDTTIDANDLGVPGMSTDRRLWSDADIVSVGGTAVTDESFEACTPGGIISAASVNETEIKGTAGTLRSLHIFSLDAAPIYVKFYNDTAANTDETDTPVFRVGMPNNATAANGAAYTANIPAGGINFSTAITFRATTGIADNDTGALTANEVLISYCYH